MAPNPSHTVRLLTGCENALRGGHRRAAYEAVREAWRTCRAPELAELVERAAEVLASEPVPAGKTRKAWRDKWLERAREGAPQETASLLRQLEPLIVAHQGSIVAACLDELLVHTDDPALTLPACALAGMDGGAVSFGSWGKVLTRLFKLIEGTGDPRAIEALESLAERVRLDPSVCGVSAAQSLLERIPKLLERLRSRSSFETPGEPTQDILEHVRSAREALDTHVASATTEHEPTGGPSDEDLLLTAALDATDGDDAPWEVYADALVQRGDPRGELIALQIAGKTSPKAAKAAQKLLEKHRRAWLGPLASAVVMSTVEMNHGFLSACETDVRRKSASDTIFSHGGWSTVRRLGFRGYGRLTSAMVRLEEAYGVPESGLVELATITLPRLRVLDVRHNQRGFRVLSKARGLPALRSLTMHLRFTSPDEVAWVFEAPFGADLEALAVLVDWRWTSPGEITAWPRACRSFSPALRLLELHAESAALVLELEEKRGSIRVLDQSAPFMEAGLSRAAQRHVEALGYRWSD